MSQSLEGLFIVSQPHHSVGGSRNNQASDTAKLRPRHRAEKTPPNCRHKGLPRPPVTFQFRIWSLDRLALSLEILTPSKKPSLVLQVALWASPGLETLLFKVCFPCYTPARLALGLAYSRNSIDTC